MTTGTERYYDRRASEYDQVYEIVEQQEEIVERVEAGSVVLFVDSSSVHVNDHPIVRTDEDGNTFQLRELRDGTEWEVLKNFPDLKGLGETLDGYGEHVEVRSLQYFWTARFDTQ